MAPSGHRAGPQGSGPAKPVLPRRGQGVASRRARQGSSGRRPWCQNPSSTTLNTLHLSPWTCRSCPRCAWGRGSLCAQPPSHSCNGWVLPVSTWLHPVAVLGTAEASREGGLDWKAKNLAGSGHQGPRNRAGAAALRVGVPRRKSLSWRSSGSRPAAPGAAPAPLGTCWKSVRRWGCPGPL